MSSLHSSAVLMSTGLLIGACVIVPSPTNDITTQTSFGAPLVPASIVALTVESTASPESPTENEQPLDPELAAQQIRTQLTRELVDDELFGAVVAPGDNADYDMTVTITDFDDETLIAGKTQALNGDGLNQLTAEVTVEKRAEGAPFQYLVKATAPSESYYNPYYGDTGVQPMLREAVNGIVEGLYLGIDEHASLEIDNIADAN